MLSPFESEIAEACQNLRGRPRNCARNAFQNIRKAYELIDKDGNMAAFRAITAEEEAATAVYLAVKEAGYPGSSEINFRDHLHKASLYQYVAAVSNLFNKLFVGTFDIRLDKNLPRVDFLVPAEQFFGDTAKGERLSPDEPLNFSIFGKYDAYDFQKEWEKITGVEGRKNIIDVLKRGANFRNRLLYATEEGIPEVQNASLFVDRQKKRVSLLAVIAICIQQTRIHQLFVTQSIACLAYILRDVDKYLGAIDHGQRKNAGVLVIRDLDGNTVIRYVRQFQGTYQFDGWVTDPHVTVRYFIPGVDSVPTIAGDSGSK